MDPSMQQQPQYYYAPGAPTGAVPPGYYPAHAGSGDAGAAANGYVLPMQQQQMPHMQQPQYYYAPAPPAAGYAYAAPMYYQPPEAAFAALSMSGQTLLPMQHQQQQLQPQQTPGASSTTSNGSQPRAASTPIPPEEPASLGAPAACNPSMVPMHVMYTQMPQYYSMPAGYEGAQMMPMMYQDPATGQMMQHMQPMQQMQQQHMMNRGMMSTDPEAVPESIDDISQISHHSSPDLDMTPGLHAGYNQRHPTTPVSSQQRQQPRRLSLPPSNQNGNSHMMPSNYKTRMCTQWMEKRDCSMGGACKFAHGNGELRLPERPFRAISNPKYKTKMCKNFEPGSTGLCAYAERCEYIHPTDPEYGPFKSHLEQLARARGDFPRYKAMLDGVPGAHRGRGAAGDGDESSKSVRSLANSSCGSARGDGSPPRGNGRGRGPARGNGAYLGGSVLPQSATRSAIRMGAGADTQYPHGDRDAPAPLMRRGYTGSMYNLASGTYAEHRDEHRQRLSRMPSASNVASMGAGGGGGSRASRYGGPHHQQPAKFNRRASMCHLNTAVDY